MTTWKKISEKKNKGRFHWKKEKNKGEILHEKENLKSNEIDFTHKSSTCTGIQKVSTVTILHSYIILILQYNNVQNI